MELSGFKCRNFQTGIGALKLSVPQVRGCWAHVRRKFFEASKLDPRDARSVVVVVAIGKLYEVERQALAKLTALEREELRQRECPALLAAVKALVEEGAGVALPKSGLGRACSYGLKQWERLECYAGAGHGMLEIDNNWAENAMRPIALGRKNWIQIGSGKAGPKIAAILCRCWRHANGLGCTGGTTCWPCCRSFPTGRRGPG
jgi:transposase